MSALVCPCCRAEAAGAVQAALLVLADHQAVDADRRVAAEVAERALAVLRQSPGEVIEP